MTSTFSCTSGESANSPKPGRRTGPVHKMTTELPVSGQPQEGADKGGAGERSGSDTPPMKTLKLEQDAMAGLSVSGGSVANVHFSSASNEWSTPQDFYDAQHAVHNFTLDPCCTHENAKCAKHYTQAEDGLKQDWSQDRVWMNPPYGREIGIWMRKAYEESLRGALVVCLVPARTDTAWWHDYAEKGEVTFIRGRLKFGGHTNSAPFPSALVVLKLQNHASATAVRVSEPGTS